MDERLPNEINVKKLRLRSIMVEEKAKNFKEYGAQVQL